MVKNINTFHLTEKIRLGRHTSENQPEHTIVLNAGKTEIPHIESPGFYVSPMRHGVSSNVLMYSPETKEVVFGNDLSLQSITELGSSSNVKTRFKHLEVEQLDVVNVTTINTYYIDNPEFVVGDSNSDAHDRASIKMVKGRNAVSFEYDGDLTFRSDTPLNVTIDGALHSKSYFGDGGLLSNVTYDQLGYVMPHLRVTEDIHAHQYHGDGRHLTGLTLGQIGDITSNNLTVASVTTQGNVNVGSELHIDGIVRASRSVVAYEFIGDGRRLYGVAQESDLKSNVSRIETLEQLGTTLTSKVTDVHHIPHIITKCDSLEYALNALEPRVTQTEKFESRFSKLEYIPDVIDTHSQDIVRLTKDTQKIGAYIPIIIQSDSDVRKLNTYVPIIENNVGRILRIEQNLPRLHTLETATERLETYIPRIKNLEAHVPKIGRLETYVPRIEALEPLTPKVAQLEQHVDVLKPLTRKVAQVEPRVRALEVLPARVKTLEDQVPRVDILETHIPRFEPLEALVSTIHSTESNVHTIQNEIPPIDARLTHVESILPRSLQDIMSYESNTVTTLQLSNVITSLTTSGNIGIGTTDPTSRISIYSAPNIVSEIGEVNGIKINELAQINAYIKANNGTTSGRPGGLVFKTKRPNGLLENSMTLDGNGCLTVGSSTPHPSAALAVDSTTRGLLVPRVVGTDIIKKPEPGLIVYDTETDTFWGYKRTGWTTLC